MSELIKIWSPRIFFTFLAIAGVIALGRLDYLSIKHLVETWPPRTFLNGAEVFCFIPFLTTGTLMYGGMLWMAITGELNEEKNE